MSKTWKIIIVVIAIIAVIIIWGGVYYWQNKTKITQIPSDENGQKTAVYENTISYNNKALGISFLYPSDWKLGENKTNKSITVDSPEIIGGNGVRYTPGIRVYIPAETYDEYENTNKEPMNIKKISIPSIHNEYQAREYSRESGLYYLIQIGEHFVGVKSEQYWKQEEGLRVGLILDTISFSSVVTTTEQTAVITKENSIATTTGVNYDIKTGNITTGDNKIIYTFSGTDPRWVGKPAVYFYGFDGSKLILWETGSDDSPGPGWDNEIWLSDKLEYLDFSNLAQGLKPYVVSEAKKQAEKKLLEQYK